MKARYSLQIKTKEVEKRLVKSFSQTKFEAGFFVEHMVKTRDPLIKEFYLGYEKVNIVVGDSTHSPSLKRPG